MEKLPLWHPEVRDDGLAELLADFFGNLAACNAVLNPVLADSLVGACKRHSVDHIRVREERRVEVYAHFSVFAPVYPALEVAVVDFVALDALAAEFAVNGVQVKTRRPGDILHCLVDVSAELFGIAGFAHIVARRLNAVAGKRGVGSFETADVVALPAVHRKLDCVERLQSLFGVYAELGVRIHCVFVIVCHMKTSVPRFYAFSSLFYPQTTKNKVLQRNFQKRAAQMRQKSDCNFPKNRNHINNNVVYL